jgi:hypothetical protein
MLVTMSEMQPATLPEMGHKQPHVRFPEGAKFFAPVQTGREAHPASCTMGNEALSRAKSGSGVALTTHPPSSTEVKEWV